MSGPRCRRHRSPVRWAASAARSLRQAQDVERGREWLLRLVDILPDLRVVLCLGNAARDAVAPTRARLEARKLSVLTAPHPSQRVYNVTKGTARDSVHAVFDEAMKLVSTRRTGP